MVLFAFAAGLSLFFPDRTFSCSTSPSPVALFPASGSGTSELLGPLAAAASSAGVTDGNGVVGCVHTIVEDPLAVVFLGVLGVTIGLAVPRPRRYFDGVRYEPILGRAALDGVFSSLPMTFTEYPSVSVAWRLRFLVGLLGVDTLSIPSPIRSVHLSRGYLRIHLLKTECPKNHVHQRRPRGSPYLVNLCVHCQHGA